MRLTQRHLPWRIGRLYARNATRLSEAMPELESFLSVLYNQAYVSSQFIHRLEKLLTHLDNPRDSSSYRRSGGTSSQGGALRRASGHTPTA
jgi:hypothetical protein